MTRYRKYALNQNVFEDIDNEESSYWLGFIYADGNVSNNYKYINIHLANSDASHLEKAKSFFEYSGPIQIISNGLISKLCIYSPKIIKDLNKHGVFPNKTFKISWPRLNDELYSHFVRGYFDGDGHISKNSYFAIASGSEEFILSVRNFLDIKAKLKKNKIYKHKHNCYYYRRHGSYMIESLYNVLYDDANILMERKHDLFIEAIKNRKGSFSKKVAMYDCDMNFIKLYSSIKEASDKFKIDGSSISKCCRGKIGKAGGYKWRYYEN